MKWFSSHRLSLFVRFVALSLALTTSVFAAAPDNLIGKIFRVGPYISSTRAAVSSSLSLTDESHYTYLLYQRGNALDDARIGAVYKLGLLQPADGTYTYQRTDETNATLLLQRAPTGSAVVTYALRFQTDTAGTFTSSDSVDGGTTSTFTLINPADFQSLPLINTALRGKVGGGQSLIAGIVVPGTTPRTFLIRAVGPGLGALGVTNVWADPDFQLYRGATALSPANGNFNYAHYGDWSVDQGGGLTPGYTASAFQKLFAYLGAFPLTVGSKDAADIVQLSPGAYTIVCSPSGADPGGETLIEVYLLP